MPAEENSPDEENNKMAVLALLVDAPWMVVGMAPISFKKRLHHNLSRANQPSTRR